VNVSIQQWYCDISNETNEMSKYFNGFCMSSLLNAVFIEEKQI